MKRSAISIIIAMCFIGSALALTPSMATILPPKMPPTISLDSLGGIILGPIETNLGGSGKGTLWPPWNPTSSRQIDTFGGVPPAFTYKQGVCQWGIVETADGTYDWSLFDMVWAELTQQAVKNVTCTLQNLANWAAVGNAYSIAGATITVASPGVVTAAGNIFANGWEVVFMGGTVPTGLSLNTGYYVVSNGVDGAGKFRVSATLNGAAINTTGSPGTSTVTPLNSIPADLGKLSTWITSVLTRATQDGLPIKYIEGMNEPNNGIAANAGGTQFFLGSMADIVAIQHTIYAAAKAYDPTIQVLSPPPNGFTAGGVDSPIMFSGGLTFVSDFLTAGGGPYADIIGFHGYAPDPGTFSPATYNTAMAALLKAIAANGGGSKPVWNTEYSTATSVAASNATYLSWTQFVDMSYGLARRYFYAWDGGDNLWCPPQTCTPNGALNVAGTAYQQIINWLVGKNMTLNTSISNGVMTTTGLTVNGVVMSANFTGPGGYQSRAVWTSDASTPNYIVPPWAVQYRTIAGGLTTGLTGSGSAVAIGANPILFEN